jgi:hypothetical protein
MSKRKWVAAKLFAVLGGAGLATCICLSRASALTIVPPFSASNYVNRYICEVSSDENFYTGVMSLYPNGAGAYTAGTLNAPISPFGAGLFNPANPPVDNTCSYSLILPESSYVVSANGLTVEVLSWKAAGGNNAACPVSPGSFVMSNEVVLRANLNTAGAVQRLQLTSGNLLNQGITFDNPGEGQCFK